MLFASILCFFKYDSVKIAANQVLQIFGFDCCQIDTDDAVSDVLIQRCSWVFLHRSIFPAQVIQAGLLVTDQVSAAKLVLVDQLHSIGRLHQRIPLGVSDQNGS